MAMSATNATAIMETQEVSLAREGRTILRDVGVRVMQGEIHALLGVNGCGKSSLAYALMGCADYQTDAGRIRFDGRDITELPIPARARLGLTLAWQEPARFEGLLVGDYLTLAQPDMTRAQLWAALQAVALDPSAYLRRPLSQALSGGERKRIELVAVYAMHPRLAILDEPDSGIDVLSVGEIARLVQQMAGEGITILLITHRDEMLAAADRASLMIAGRIVTTGRPAEVRIEFARRCGPQRTQLGPLPQPATAASRRQA